MIYITGDTHGEFGRFPGGDVLPGQRRLLQGDYVIVCGDFGLCWAKDKEFEYHCDFFAKKPFTLLWVQGNHENYDAYKGYPKEEWHGGQIQRIRPSVLHLMRGQVYELNGRKFFTMGGASSHDIQDGILEPDDPDSEEKFQQLEQRGALFRVNHRSWWAEELPSEAEYLEARANLARVHWNVDYIISHCCPSSIQDVFSGGMFKKDALTEFFDEVRQKCTFQYWFFGHYHSNMVIEKRYAMLYEQIIRLK